MLTEKKGCKLLTDFQSETFAFRVAVFVRHIEGPYYLTLWAYNAFRLPKRYGTTSQVKV